MADVLVDEDLPRSLAGALQNGGLVAQDVRDIGRFGNLLRFPLGSHAGIVIARFPNEVSTAQLVSAIVRAVGGLADDEVVGNLIVVEPGRVRLRRAR